MHGCTRLRIRCLGRTTVGELVHAAICEDWSQHGPMAAAPIVVHRPSPTGGRRVTVRRAGRDEILGLAHSDHDLVVFLEGAGILDPELIVDDPVWVEWRGSRAHQWDAA